LIHAFQEKYIQKISSIDFVIPIKAIIFALSILHEQTTAKARSKLVG